MGPLLLFRGCADGLWRLSATLSSMDAPPALRTDSGGASEPVLLLDEADIRIWRYDFALEMRAVERSETYHIGDRSWPVAVPARSEEHTSELQSLMRISYAVFCL